MKGRIMMNLARVGFVFSFDLPRGVTTVSRQDGKDVTDFDRDRVADAFPGDVVAKMDDNKRIVVLH